MLRGVTCLEETEMGISLKENACGHLTDRGYNTTTSSGGRLYPKDLREEDVNIVDIAEHLSRICRFGGALRCGVEFYSVAQHSVLVSRVVPEQYALEGLLHDAAEATTGFGDIVKPVKLMFPDVSAFEDKHDAVIRRKFGLPEKMSPCVKEADIRMVWTEKRDLLAEHSATDWGAPIEPYPEVIEPLLPFAARELFIRRFIELQLARLSACA